MTGGLDILFDSHKEELEQARHHEVQQAEGDDLQLHLILPEGREETLAAKLGQTVQYTKAVLHERYNVPIDKQFYLPQMAMGAYVLTSVGNAGSQDNFEDLHVILLCKLEILRNDLIVTVLVFEVAMGDRIAYAWSQPMMGGAADNSSRWGCPRTVYGMM